MKIVKPKQRKIEKLLNLKLNILHSLLGNKTEYDIKDIVIELSEQEQGCVSTYFKELKEDGSNKIEKLSILRDELLKDVV